MQQGPVRGRDVFSRVPGLSHPILPTDLQPMVGSCFSLGMSPSRQVSGIFLYQHMPLLWAEEPCATGMQLRGSDCGGTSIASSCYQYGLLCNASKRCYTTSMCWSVLKTLRTLPTSTTKAVYAHVATRLLSPPLESEASEVASRHSYPRRAQSCSRRALTSARPPGRMATPTHGSPADWETLQRRSDRPVCLPRPQMSDQGHALFPARWIGAKAVSPSSPCRQKSFSFCR